MDVALSDLLTCPRCGPTYGLVLLPAEVRDRRVRSGVLGCANCRERFPVVEGVADLRVGGAGGGVGASSEAGGEGGVGGGPESAEESAVRLAALLGLTDGGGTVLVAGPAARQASALVEVVPEVSVVVIDGGPVAGPETALRVTDRLPFRSGSLRGVVLTGARGSLLEEGARVVGGGGRLVLDPAPGGWRERVTVAGLRVLLEEAGTVVAGRGR